MPAPAITVGGATAEHGLQALRTTVSRTSPDPLPQGRERGCLEEPCQPGPYVTPVRGLRAACRPQDHTVSRTGSLTPLPQGRKGRSGGACQLQTLRTPCRGWR